MQLNGSRPSPLQPGRLFAECLTPVAMFTVTLPIPFATTTTVGGLKLQEAFKGIELHEKANVVAGDPVAGTRLSVYVAVCPLATVLLDDPEALIEKSNPIPESPTWTGAASELLESDKLPVCCPAPVGLKATCTVQDPEISRVALQVEDAI